MLAELVPRNRFLGFLKVQIFGLWSVHPIPLVNILTLFFSLYLSASFLHPTVKPIRPIPPFNVLHLISHISPHSSQYSNPFFFPPHISHFTFHLIPLVNKLNIPHLFPTTLFCSPHSFCHKYLHSSCSIFFALFFPLSYIYCIPRV
jgi:hypothetical protein